MKLFVYISSMIFILILVSFCFPYTCLFITVWIIILVNTSNSFNRARRQFMWGNEDSEVPVSTTTDGSTTTAASASFLMCFQNCPRLSQYNPVCGNDGTSYHNNATLNCANTCGRRK